MPNKGMRYSRYVKCRRCGSDMEYGPHVTHRSFCSKSCRVSFWADRASTGATRKEVAAKVLGSGAPNVDLTVSQLSWLGALVDGEGTVSIWREARKGNRSGYRYRPVVALYNTNEPLIDAAALLLSGHKAIMNREKVCDRIKPCWKFQVNQRAVGPLIRQLKPYLIAKREQAEVLEMFCDEMDKAPMRTSQVHEIFEELRQRMRRLNRRGNTKE